MTGAHRTSMPPAYRDVEQEVDKFHDEAPDDDNSTGRARNGRSRTLWIWSMVIGSLLILAIMAWRTGASASFNKATSNTTAASVDDGKNDFNEEIASEVLGDNGTESTSAAKNEEVTKSGFENSVLDIDVPASDEIEKNDNMVEQDIESTTSFDLRTGNERIDRAYNLAKKELYESIAAKESSVTSNNSSKGKDSHFSGGNQRWHRRTTDSYAIELAAGLVAPDFALNSLVQSVEMVTINGEGSNRSVWYQDEHGDFGGWPYLSDAIVGARGSYFLFLYTGNMTLLKWAYETTIYSLKRAEQGVLRHGLFHGCSSFMASNSGYPLKYNGNGTLVGRTKALSTNMLYYNGYKMASQMGHILLDGGAKKSSILSKDVLKNLDKRADDLKKEIRNRFWMEEKGFYAYFEDENGVLVQQMEGLGESLVLLSEEFEELSHRIRSILDHTYRSEIGIPCLWPPFDHGKLELDDNHISERYHNGRIWPFVMGYYAIAAARKGRIDIFASEMLNLVKLSEQGNTFAEFYELNMTFPNKRRRQLWSDTGYLGMVYQGLFGMVFGVEGIVFAPSKPRKHIFLEMDATISLLNVQYRNATLDIHVSGFGNKIQSFKLNGELRSKPRVGASSHGKQVVEIVVTET